MSSALLAVTFDAADPAELADFWSDVLSREVVSTSIGALLPGDDRQVGLQFEATDTEKHGLNRLHLHLTSDSLEHQQATVARSVELGGRHIDVGQLPVEGHIVLADPGDNEFCVLGPGNSFLAGCGFLAEVACDGTRDVGLFWRDALDWPLVWDRDQETAVQSPGGGTKVAWGGPPVAEKSGCNRQRFELVTDDVPAEVQRLVALGATRITDLCGTAELADPDGNEFCIRPL